MRAIGARYVDADGLVTVKGRVAAEVQSADELLLTELLFTGVFQARRAWTACSSHPSSSHAVRMSCSGTRG